MSGTSTWGHGVEWRLDMRSWVRMAPGHEVMGWNGASTWGRMAPGHEVMGWNGDSTWGHGVEWHLDMGSWGRMHLDRVEWRLDTDRVGSWGRMAPGHEVMGSNARRDTVGFYRSLL